MNTTTSTEPNTYLEIGYVSEDLPSLKANTIVKLERFLKRLPEYINKFEYPMEVSIPYVLLYTDELIVKEDIGIFRKKEHERKVKVYLIGLQFNKNLNETELNQWRFLKMSILSQFNGIKTTSIKAYNCAKP
jgi:hypothetical protein